MNFKTLIAASVASLTIAAAGAQTFSGVDRADTFADVVAAICMHEAKDGMVSKATYMKAVETAAAQRWAKMDTGKKGMLSLQQFETIFMPNRVQ